jgi:hypothetical protein
MADSPCNPPRSAPLHVLNVLFLVQVVACLLAAVSVLATRHLLAVAGAALLMAGTIVGFLLARSVGIFGWLMRKATSR